MRDHKVHVTEKHLNTKEIRGLLEFSLEHEHKCGSFEVAVQFECTGIGTTKVAICRSCKAERNVTDFDDW